MEFAGTGPVSSGKQLSLLTSLPFTTGRDVFGVRGRMDTNLSFLLHSGVITSVVSLVLEAFSHVDSSNWYFCEEMSLGKLCSVFLLMKTFTTT